MSHGKQPRRWSEETEDRTSRSTIIEGTGRRSSLRNSSRRTIWKPEASGFAKSWGWSMQEEIITIVTCKRTILIKSRERAQKVHHVGWQSLFHNVICTKRVRKLVVATGVDFCNIQCHCSCVGHEERGRESVPLDGGLLLLLPPCLLFCLCPTVQAHTLKGL